MATLRRNDNGMIIELLPTNPEAAKIIFTLSDPSDLPILEIGDESNAYHELFGWKPIDEWLPHLEECIQTVIDGGYSVYGLGGSFRMTFELPYSKPLRVSHGFVIIPMDSRHYQPYDP